MIQGNIEGLEDDGTKLEDLNTVWIMEEFNRECSVVDTEGYEETTLYHSMKKWLNIEKGQSEADTYFKRSFEDSYKYFYFSRRSY